MTGPLVVITSKCHVPRMHAHKILIENDYSPWIMVVDDNSSVRIAKDLGIDNVISTNKPIDIPRMDGIAWTRQWIEDNIVPRGDWYVSLDDNVRGWTHLPVPHYHRERIDFYSSPESNGLTWRQLFETPLPFAGVVKYWQELIDECENAYTLAGGFAIETNYFFRSIKWQRLGYVRAQNAVWKNTGLPFYYWRGAMLEDFVRTVDVVSRCNQVLINRFIKPQKTFFEEGGIGPFEDRRPKLVACCNNLLSRYPGLLRPVKEQDYSLTFVPKSPSGVAKWRQQRDQAQ